MHFFGSRSTFKKKLLRLPNKILKQRSSLYSWNSCNFACKQKKTTIFYRFESVQNLVSFFYVIFFRLLLVYFAAEASIVFNLFLNVVQK